MGYLSGAAGELLRAIERAAGTRDVYVAAALARQLVEFEYLMWAFAGDQEEAATWLNASNDEHRAMWQPRHLRARSDGRFKAHDYGLHCELGGHPTPSGLRLLMGAQSEAAGELLLVDSINHAHRVWRSVRDCAKEPADGDVESLDREIVDWRRHDPLAKLVDDGLAATGFQRPRC